MKLLAIICLFLSLALPAKADIRDCINATVKVHCQSGQSLSTGTGVVFGIENGKVFIITNSHVIADNPKNVSIIAYKWGHRSKEFKCTVVKNIKNSEVDVAILTIPQAEFKGQEPKPIPIAPYGTKLKVGDCLYSNGCAKGAEPSLIATREISDNGVNIEFRPPPAEGRSGSGMFNKEGTQIVGLLYARSIESSAVGMAVSLDMLHKYLYKKSVDFDSYNIKIKPHVLLPFTVELPVKEHVLLPYLTQETYFMGPFSGKGGQCGPGGCPSQRQPPRNPQKPQQPNEGSEEYGERLDGSVPFPTLPPEEAKPEVKPQLPQDKPPLTQGTEKGGLGFPNDWLKKNIHYFAIVFLIIVILIFVVPASIRNVKQALLNELKKGIK